jgi:hypothetical protein
MRIVVRSVLATLCITLLPSVAAAQASLAGTVRDASGAVLPGVTVEASSPALIERTRTAVTDGTGQYRITELRPGAYSLTFTLPGFTTVQREGVNVSGIAVITIDAELRVGGVQETITVTGETPIVDVQSTRRQAVIDNEVVNALPASRGYGNLLMAVPAVQVNLLNSATDPTMQFFTVHGGRSNEGRVQIDGLNVGSAFNGGGVSSFAYDTANVDEIQIAVSGGLGEADIGGPALNIIPRTGGNNFRGTVFSSHAGEWSQGSNLDDRLRAANITENPALIKSWDTSVSMGGPILRDRLWFFGTARTFGNHTDNAGLYGNLNVGDASKWTWARDAGTKSRSANDKKVGAGRLTAQLGAKNKVGFYYDYQHNCGGSTLTKDAEGCRARGDDWVGLGNFFGITSPESGTMWDDREIIVQGTWSATVTNRLLLEAGASTFISRWGGQDPGGALISFIPVTEQSGIYGRTNWTYRGLDGRFGNDQAPRVWRASASYVTGAHALKFGNQGAYQIHNDYGFAGANQLTYRFNSQCALLPGSTAPCSAENGTITPVANQFTMRLAPRTTMNRTTFEAFYAQDQWTMNRMTVQAAIRYEWAKSWAPEGNGIVAASRFNSAPIVFPRTESVAGYHDISPRVGVAYDVFGTGRTALKVNVGHYLASANNEGNFTINNPVSQLQTSTNRAWTDANRNFTPDCELMNPAAQDLRASGGDFCGAWSQLAFGDRTNLTQVNPDTLRGWGTRAYDWKFGVGLQQEVLPRISVEVSYNRRWFGNFFYTDNLALGPQDYDQATISAPRHENLPDGGGYPVTFLVVKPDNFNQTRNYFTFASDYGDDTRYWHGVDTTINARTTWGLTLQGGTNTGRGVRDNCEITAKLPETVGSAQVDACHVAEKWLTSFRGLATYRVPRVDVLVSAIMRSQVATTPANAVAMNGSSLSANYVVSNAIIQSLIGRPLAGTATNFTVNLLKPGELYQDRLNAVDMRFAKTLRFSGKRADIGVDLYNLFNGNTATGYDNGFGTDGSTWLRPTAVLNPRFVRFNLTFDF